MADLTKLPARLLIAGELHLAEFQPECLGGHPDWTRCTFDDVSTQWSTGQFDVLVLAFDRPGRIADVKIQGWRKVQPARPIVSLLSSHCEGDPRARQVDQPTIRIDWHKWAFEFDKFQRQWEATGDSDWHRSLDRSAVDLRVDPLSGPSTTWFGPLNCRVGVAARTELAAETIAEHLQQAGCRVDWILPSDQRTGTADRRSQTAWDAVVVDADSLDPDCLHRVATLKRQSPNAPLALILGGPRPQDIRQARSLGVDQIVSKPWEWLELHWCIHRLISIPAPDPTDTTR